MSIAIVVMIRMLPSFNRLIFNFNQFKYCSESILKVHNLILMTEENKFSNKELTFKESIELQNIEFSYSNKDSIFKDLNLIIPNNSKIGIIGETGSGKSTLVDLIIGLTKPTNGSILVDKNDINNNKTGLKIFHMCPKNFYSTAP